LASEQDKFFYLWLCEYNKIIILFEKKKTISHPFYYKLPTHKLKLEDWKRNVNQRKEKMTTKKDLEDIGTKN
jgi:hypothetical protein